MKLDLRYLGKSEVRPAAGGASALAFSPNLARPKVFFDGEVKNPVRFREAMSALHDVVVGDLRIKKKDKSAYEAWRKNEADREIELRKQFFDEATKREVEKIGKETPPPNLEADFQKMHGIYWKARVRWANELAKTDPTLFRHLVPCDPVVTVAPDVVFFECFAKDESAYGCLTASRDAFRGDGATSPGLGTTNVDYSLALYDHFQTLRTYRPTRLLVDPTGFEVKVEGSADYREEKIDLPPSWLRGFGQLQAAMALPARRIELSVDAVYSLLALLRRNREKTGPRSVRVRLEPGKAPLLVVDPWNIPIASRGKPYEGDTREEIKLWGRRRLFPLARVLPLAERVEVLLYGSGLPSVWMVHMGEMRLVLALSGWTANDWTSGSNLDLRFADYRPDAAAAEALGRYLAAAHRATLADLARQVSVPSNVLLGSLHALAKRGQLVYDFADGVYRYRQVMPVALSEAVLGPESEELSEGKRLAREGAVKLERQEALAGGRRLLVARVGSAPCEGLLDPDGGFTKAKCNCSFFFKTRLRAGPCRHLLALRIHGLGLSAADTPEKMLSAAPDERPRRSQLFQMSEAILGEMRSEASRRGVALYEIAEQAWRIARDVVQQSASLDQLRDRVPDKDRAPPAPKTPQSFDLAPRVLEDVQQEAARLDASISQLMSIAWELARGTMRLTSSIFR